MYSRFMKAVPGREPLVTGPRAFPTPANGGSQGGSVILGSSCVLMAYGLDPQQANPDRLFNLFCLYGNVIRVSYKIGIIINQFYYSRFYFHTLIISKNKIK